MWFVDKLVLLGLRLWTTRHVKVKGAGFDNSARFGLSRHSRPFQVCHHGCWGPNLKAACGADLGPGDVRCQPGVPEYVLVLLLATADVPLIGSLDVQLTSASGLPRITVDWCRQRDKVRHLVYQVRTTLHPFKPNHKTRPHLVASRLRSLTPGKSHLATYASCLLQPGVA